MKELFEKVYIKSETDLPNEGIYIAKVNDEIAEHQIMRHLPLETNANYQTWKYKCDWYFRPIEQKIDVPTEQEIVDSFEYVNPVFVEGAKWAIDEIIKRNK